MSWLSKNPNEELLFNNENNIFSWKGLYPRIVCNNGVSFSVQASSFHYCIPRDNNGPYSHVEVGFLERTEHPSEWQEYREGKDGDIYAYIPIELVVDFIRQNGGISQKTLESNQPKPYANLEWNEGE